MRTKHTLVVWLLFTCFSISAQQRYAHQLTLIDSVRQFIVHNLKMSADTDFYTHWDTRKDSMAIYLYVSRNDSIAKPADFKSDYWMLFDVEDSAIAKSKHFKALGYETLVYRTAGTSAAKLNAKLLSYPDEAIAFIVFHEATHRRHNSDSTANIPYIYEEALCDAVANAACIKFATKTKLLDIKKVMAQKRIFESMYKLIDRSMAAINKSAPMAHAAIFKSCNSKIWALANQGNQFVKDRMKYEVNHAYYMRVSTYALHYFEIKQMLGRRIDVNAAVNAIHRLAASKR